MNERPEVVVLYHYLYPDEVVSSRHLSELCAGLADRGWSVLGIACNRGCREESLCLPKAGAWRGVRFLRIWRPGFPQSRSWGRILNMLWMTAAWSLKAFTLRTRPRALVIGTDPVMSVMCALFWRLRFPELVIAHWCFDLYPDAAVAHGLARETSLAVRLLRWLSRWAYSKCDHVVDIGSCMRRRLGAHVLKEQQSTITPWALEEPPAPVVSDPSERRAVFGEARIALLYSGSFGLAHSYDEILQLIESTHEAGVRLALSISGNRAEDFRKSARDLGDAVRVVEMAKPASLTTRLGCADIHVVSLRKEWAGMVVPSKFFGALAVGRPVVYCGPDDSAVAQWIHEFGVGWVLNEQSIAAVATEFRDLAKSPGKLAPLFLHCHEVYQRQFARSLMIDHWHSLLRNSTHQAGVVFQESDMMCPKEW